MCREIHDSRVNCIEWYEHPIIQAMIYFRNSVRPYELFKMLVGLVVDLVVERKKSTATGGRWRTKKEGGCVTISHMPSKPQTIT